MKAWLKKLRRQSRQGQIELPLELRREPDRNFHKGGRSFYFFDFDDNVAFLATPIFIFHRETGAEWALSSREFAQIHSQVGKNGPYLDYRVDYDDNEGSFRQFRDRDFSVLERLLGRRQFFIQDLAEALGYPDFHWKGPSWSCFFHAVYNQRPVSLITARGHDPKTMKVGIRQFVRQGHLPYEPHYLSIFPVSHPKVRKTLETSPGATIAELKQRAIRASVEEAFRVYGPSSHHRFGMSDDDPKNIELITEEMTRLKQDYRDTSFFIIATGQGSFIKREIFADHSEDSPIEESGSQLALF